MANLRKTHGRRPTSRRLTSGCSARPPVDGLGTLGGFKLQVEDRANLGYPALQTATYAIDRRRHSPGPTKSSQALSTFRAGVPQVYLDVDRAKAESMHVPLDAVWDTLSIYLGSLVRQRLHPFWPALPRHGAGRRAVPGQADGCEEPQDAQRQRRDGAAGHAGEGQGHQRARAGGPLQHVSHRRNHRQHRAGRQLRRCHPAHGGPGRQSPAARA